MKLFSDTINTLQTGLNYSSQKEKVIANNIANVDTPNYKAKSVNFKSELASAVDEVRGYKTNDRHFDLSSSTSQHPISITSQSEQMYSHNGNNVDIDKEMTNLAENQIYFYALSDLLNGKFSSLKSVIKGGR
ncbi:flagellar basal body rod protein FlgB [Cytobacillus sp. Hm23]